MARADRLRVLFVAHAYPRHAGDPVGSFVANLARALAESGVDVTVLAPSGPSLVARERIDGVTVHRFRYAPRGRETLAYTGTMAQAARGPVGLLTLGAFVAAGALAIRRLVNEERFDVVHAHWWFPGGLSAALALGGSGAPLVVTLHGSDLRLALGSGLGRRLLGRVARRAARVTAVSGWLATHAQDIVPGLDVEVAPMPVLATLFVPPTRPDAREGDRLLFVGKLSEQKGMRRLLDAMAQMHIPARLTVVGAGRVEDAALRAHAAALGLDARIEWLPLLSQGELAAQYRRAAVHVIPALDEGLGLTGVEALLSETPVVGFASGGLLDIVRDGRGGRLVPPGDTAALAHALDEMLGDDAMRASTGAEGRREALRIFGAREVGERYAALYRSVSGQGG